MATTTIFGIDLPDDTDLVKDGAAAIRTVGNGFDAALEKVWTEKRADVTVGAGEQNFHGHGMDSLTRTTHAFHMPVLSGIRLASLRIILSM
jgi:hypothetical protein